MSFSLVDLIFGPSRLLKIALSGPSDESQELGIVLFNTCLSG